ncbi:MAG: amino acid ABC transporter permease [Pseudonocardiales bacterium]|nr:MAG: amino acid ABC transporter permease [Pseudonocardiales bacterium]
MTGAPTDLLSVAGSSRPARRFRSPLPLAILAALAGVVVAALLAESVRVFDRSLHVTGTGLAVSRVAELAVVVAGLAVPYCGIRAVLDARRAGALARQGHLADARVVAEDSRQWGWYVLGLSLTGLTLAFLFGFFGAQDGKVRTVLFNWHYPGGHIADLAGGFWINVKLFMVTEVIVLAWALLVAVVRLIPGRAGAPMRWLAVAYVDIFRGIPALLVLYIVVFGFPLAQVPLLSSLSRERQQFWLAVLALTLTYGAYVAEVYRSGLESIHWSQTAAARSLGLSHPQTLRYVVIPQAVRRIIPPLLNDFIGLQKDTALVSIVGVLDIVNRATILKGQDFNLSYMSGAALAFLAITVPLTRFTDYLVRRDAARMRAGGS